MTETRTESKPSLRSWIRFNPPGSRTAINYYRDYAGELKDDAVKRTKFEKVVQEFKYIGFHDLWVNEISLSVAREYVNNNTPHGKTNDYYANYAAQYPTPIVEEALAYLIYENQYIEKDGCWVYPADEIAVPPVKLSFAKWISENPPYGIDHTEYYRKYQNAFKEDSIGSYTFARSVECTLDCEILYSKDKDCFVYMKKGKPEEIPFTSVNLIKWITQKPRGETNMNDYYEKYIEAFGEKAIDLNLFMKLLEFNEAVQRINVKEERKEIPVKPVEEIHYDVAGVFDAQKIEKLDFVDPKFVEIDGKKMSYAEFMQWASDKAKKDFAKQWFSPSTEPVPKSKDSEFEML